MKGPYDLLRENIARWEIRGRGVLTFPNPVSPRPPFAPFPGHWLPEYASGDDGVRPTAVSGFLSRLVSMVRSGTDDRQATPALPPPESPATIEPHWHEGEEHLLELQMRVPVDLNTPGEAMAPLLAGVSQVRNPMTFEIVGTGGGTWMQWVSGTSEADQVRRQMNAYFPDVQLSTRNDVLRDAWHAGENGVSAIMEFGLANSFMWSLGLGKVDPFVGLVGSLSSLEKHEVGLYQVIFTPLFEPWAKETVTALSKGDGKPFFDGCEPLLKAAQSKLTMPLYGVVVRIAARAANPWRSWDIVRAMVPALANFSKADGNEFVALSNEGYDETAHETDVLNRRSRRCGMLLNRDELIGLVHLPSPAVKSPWFLRISTDTRAAPAVVRDPGGVSIGFNTHDSKKSDVWLSREHRVRHMHIIGASGTGKSTLLLNMIHQDLNAGAGIGVLDPHGDLVDAILENIPEHRLDDVVLIDPSDEQYSVGFNILSAHSDFEKTLLASDLVSVFQRLSTSWGDQMGSVLSNAIRAFLESRAGGTLADLRKFLIDPGFRRQFLKSVEDPDLVYYWEKAFPQLGSNKSIGPVLTRLESFLAPKPIRYMVSQKSNKIDFGDITDSGRIFLAKLSQGQMGRENAHLLGSLLVAKFQQSAMARQRMQVQERRPFWLYIDEFQNFITPSMAEILSGARKYRFGLILAHQELNQLRREPDVANAVLANACVRVVFRVSDSDAKTLEGGFSHFFARDLQNLGVGHAICRVERSDGDFNLAVPPFTGLADDVAAEMRSRAIRASCDRYATPRSEVEAALYEAPGSTETEEPKTSRRSDLASETVGNAEEAFPSVDAPRPPVRQAKEPPPLPVELGRGGVDHRLIQQELKAAGEACGFRSTIEKQLPGTLECTDLLFERDGTYIAVEVSVTNTIDYELKNMGKCLRAGVSMVAVVSPDAQKLQKLKAAAETVYGEQSERLRFFSQSEFSQFLRDIPRELPSTPTPAPEGNTQMHKGWRVKTTVVALSPEERRECEASVARILVESVRRIRTSEE